MKDLINIFSVIFLIFFFSACEKEEFGPDPEPENPVEQPAVSFPVGQPNGELVVASIGVAGGELQSADGLAKVVIPAGALDANTEVSIQPINNTHPGGSGAGYRMLPHGTQFKKPVTITFSYADEAEKISFEDGLRIAYQNSQGHWMGLARATIDKNAKTITTQTTHFSDWSFFESLVITPVSKLIEPGETIELQVMKCVETDLLAPLNSDEERAGYAYKPVPSSLVKKWQLVGEGNLSPQGAKATYKAPSAIPAVNPVTVSAELNTSNQKLILIAEIRIMPNGIVFRIDQGDWIWASNVLNVQDGNTYAIIGLSTINSNNETGSAVQFTWEGAAQQISPWDLDETIFEYFPDETHLYGHVHGTEPLEPSSGYLKVIEFGAVGEFIEGSFNIDQAGFFDFNKEIPYTSMHQIEGYFRFKRTY